MFLACNKTSSLTSFSLHWVAKHNKYKIEPHGAFVSFIYFSFFRQLFHCAVYVSFYVLATGVLHSTLISEVTLENTFEVGQWKLPHAGRVKPINCMEIKISQIQYLLSNSLSTHHGLTGSFFFYE